MPVSAKQLNFCDVSNDFDKFYNQNQNDLLSPLLDKFISISDFIPFSFYRKYYSNFGSKRDFHLNLCLMLLLLKIFYLFLLLIF